MKTINLVVFAVGLFSAFEAHASKKFEYCMRDASKVGDSAIAQCMADETKRIDEMIYQEYEKIANDEYFKTWNNGSGMFRGRVKSLYENWYNYRKEFCSLFTLSMKNYLGSDEYNTQRCLYDLANNHYNYIKGIILNKNSTPD